MTSLVEEGSGWSDHVPSACRRELVNVRAPASACSMQLATTCILLFVGASGAGLVPLILKTSPAQLSLLSAVGAGLLVGTGLGVILPEGFEAFQKVQQSGTSPQRAWASPNSF